MKSKATPDLVNVQIGAMPMKYSAQTTEQMFAWLTIAFLASGAVYFGYLFFANITW